jgi:hypothetical protein
MKKRIDYPITEKPNGSSLTHLRVEVYYSKGGMNYFTSTNERRGIYVSASPIERRESSTSYMGFSGGKQFLLAMSRFSQKTLDNFVPDTTIVDNVINYVCEKNGIKIEKDLVGN